MKGLYGDRVAQRPHVVVIGAGFGGLRVVKGLRRAPVDVTVAIESLARASLVVRQEVRRNGELLVAARVALACVDARTLKPVRIPIDLAATAARAQRLS